MYIIKFSAFELLTRGSTERYLVAPVLPRTGDHINFEQDQYRVLDIEISSIEAMQEQLDANQIAFHAKASLLKMMKMPKETSEKSAD
ncbi:hypothetical protein [Leptolyngbya sp. GGD]|uniref:hypothetical protein n=1 Tax=Leptolyngbya sp. GGD TaxID=2997907 RepID=UPI00227C758D|nr:hypothetical protein [Leptolyngbya sp. GGD]MCY6491917.1 hypothetical protein [Leptolyngbya sp. GGD]